MCSRFCALGLVLWVLCFGFGAWQHLPRGRLDRTPPLRQYPEVAKAAVGCARRRVSRTAPIEVLKPRPSKLLKRARMCEHPRQCRPSRKLRRKRDFHRSHVHLTCIPRGSHVDPTSIPSQHSKPSGFHLCGVPNACSGRTHGISKAAFDRTTSRRTRHALRSGDVQKAESGPTVSCAIVGIPIAQSTAQTAARIADQSKEMRDES